MTFALTADEIDLLIYRDGRIKRGRLMYSAILQDGFVANLTRLGVGRLLYCLWPTKCFIR
jgi:hypothetical protein